MARSEEDVAARRHALWGLTVLVLLAVLVIAVTLFFTGTPGSQHGDRIDLGIPTAGPTPSQSATASTSSTPTPRTSTPTARQSTTRARHRTASATATTSAPAPVRASSPTRPAGNTAVPAAPCAGRTPCTVAGDGRISAALDAARQARGAGPIDVVVTSDAQRCAASGGAQCTGQYAVQTVTSQSGRQAVDALAASADNGWLFAPATASLQAGWAYLPDLHEYVVALLEA
jgi:hypothetical protein